MNALMRSDAWKDTLVVMTWDDFGGFYDHVPRCGWTTSGSASGCRR